MTYSDFKEWADKMKSVTFIKAERRFPDEGKNHLSGLVGRYRAEKKWSKT